MEHKSTRTRQKFIFFRGQQNKKTTKIAGFVESQITGNCSNMKNITRKLAQERINNKLLSFFKMYIWNTRISKHELWN